MLRPSKLLKICPVLLFLFSALFVLLPKSAPDQFSRRAVSRDTSSASSYPRGICSRSQAVRAPPISETKALWERFLELAKDFAPLLPDSPEQVNVIRDTYNSLQRQTLDDKEHDGQGIVMFVPESMAEYAATSLRTLRLLGNLLPVELWFVVETPEILAWCSELAEQAVACRFVSLYKGRNSTSGGLEADDQHKVAALLFSSFEDIIYLDSTSIPVSILDTLVESEPYLTTGLVLWPGIWPSSESNWTATIFGWQDDTNTASGVTGTIDGAQFIVNKRKHWKTLVLLAYHVYHANFFYPLLSSSAPIDRGFSASLYGAARATELPFRIVKPGPEQVSKDAPISGKGKGKGGVALHYSPDPTKATASTQMDTGGEDNDVTNPLAFVEDSRFVLMHTSTVRFGARELMCDKRCDIASERATPISSPIASETPAGLWPFRRQKAVKASSEDHDASQPRSGSASAKGTALEKSDESWLNLWNTWLLLKGQAMEPPSQEMATIRPQRSASYTNLTSSTATAAPASTFSNGKSAPEGRLTDHSTDASDGAYEIIHAALRAGDPLLSVEELDVWGLADYEELLWSAIGSLLCEREPTEKEKVMAKTLEEAKKVASFRALRAMLVRGGSVRIPTRKEEGITDHRYAARQSSVWREDTACKNLKEYGRKRFGEEWRWEDRGTLYPALSCRIDEN